MWVQSLLFLSSSMGCANWNIAGMILPESRSCAIGQVLIRRTSGKLANLVRSLESEPLAGDYGIGHTRWATHGRPTEENAHPHRDCTGRIVVVHNGIIENYLELKTRLQESNHRFVTETDTEVIAHLVESMLPGRTFPEAACAAMEQLRGSLAVCMISADCPGTIFAARNGPPLIVGLGDKEYFVASDVPALLEHTRNYVFYEGRRNGHSFPGGVVVQDFHGQGDRNSRRRKFSGVRKWRKRADSLTSCSRKFMSSPAACGKLSPAAFPWIPERSCSMKPNIPEDVLSKIERIHIVACGTSWHAALVGKFLIEDFARIPVEIDYGSEFRYRNPLVNANSLVIAISQSGETADTLAAVREAKAKHARILSICNVVGSMLSRESDGNLYTRSGPEIGVASTKAFTSQIAVLVLVALYLARARKQIPQEQMVPLLSELARVPHCIEQLLDQTSTYEEIARRHAPMQ